MRRGGSRTGSSRRDGGAVRACIQWVRGSYGGLQGVVHAAGVIQDRFILKKGWEEFCEVLGPKVLGSVNLDEATREEELDFFIVFSSVSGVLGNIGQSDYASGNAYLD